MEDNKNTKQNQDTLNLIEVLNNLDNVLKYIYQKINVLETKIDNIEQSLSTTNSPIHSDILNIPKLNKVGNPANVTLTKKKELTKFNREKLTELYHQVEDDWSKKMINTILTGKYDTVTEKQLKKIEEIATGVGFDESIIL